ncbi:unnamed protein product [Closterium sp. Naga37s-1]|nr:unnamed protein product [Closterium sp. Naga37s-1]
MPSLLSHIAPPCCSPACRFDSPLASPLFLPHSTPPTSPHRLAPHRRPTPAPPPTARHRLRLSLSFPSASPPMLQRHPFPASTPTQCPSFRPSAASSRIRRLSPARRRGAGAAVAQAAAGDGAGDVQTFILTAGALAAAAVSLRLALKVPLSAHPLRAPTPRTHSAHPLRHPFSPRCSSSGRPPLPMPSPTHAYVSSLASVLAAHMLAAHMLAAHMLAAHMLAAHMLAAHMLAAHVLAAHMLAAHMLAAHMLAAHMLATPHTLARGHSLCASYLPAPLSCAPHSLLSCAPHAVLCPCPAVPHAMLAGRPGAVCQVRGKWLLPALSHMFPSPFLLVTPVLCPSSVRVAGLAGGTACVFCEGGKMAGKDGRLMDCRVCKGAGEGAWGQVRAYGGR